MRFVLIFLALAAFGWAGWRAADARSDDRLPVSFAMLVEEPDPEAENPDASAPMGIEGVAQARGPDLSEALSDVVMDYARPRAITAESTQSVTLVIQPASAAAIATAVRSAHAESGQGDVEPYISASLTGQGFAIERLEQERRPLTVDAPNAWLWSITALTPPEGEENAADPPAQDGGVGLAPQATNAPFLTLEVFAYPGERAPASPVRAYRDAIAINVDARDQAIAFARYGQPVYGAVAGGVLAIIALFGFGRRRAG